MILAFILIYLLPAVNDLTVNDGDKSWDLDKLAAAMEYAEEIGTFGLVIQTQGDIVISYGDIERISRVHSIRKSILSALVFQNLDHIDPQATLRDLEIVDSPIPLTELQLQAKVIHLLKSTSGINHPTGSQVGSMQADRDALLGHEPNIPGTKWAYNNWDYNVLTTILEMKTEKSVGQLFEEGIASPLGIGKFETFYRADSNVSMHAKAGFRLSTRDMANFGQLFLNLGKWEGQQLIPREWVDKISTDYTPTKNQSNERYGHGYLWWIPDPSYAKGLLPPGSFISTGAWGQRLVVIPKWNTVIAHKTMTEIPVRKRNRVTKMEFENLVVLIVHSKK